MDKYKLLLLLPVFLLVISFASADHEPGHGVLSIDINEAGGIVGVPFCQEDWSGSNWGSCTNNQQTFICFDKNTCGSIDLRPALCGEIRACDVEDTSTTETTTTSSGGGSGGSGGSGSGSFGSFSGEGANFNPTSLGDEFCQESWACEDWSKSDKSCGTRTCQDKNNCGTELLKPVTSQECSSTGFTGVMATVLDGVTSLATGERKGLTVILLIISVAMIAVYMKKKKSV